MYKYYALTLKIGEMRHLYTHYETLWSTNLCAPLMCEVSMCLIHSPPKLFEGCFDIVMLSDVTTGGEIMGNYSYDSIISIVMLLRVYMLFRLFHFCCGNLSSDSRMVAMFNKVDIGPWFTFRRCLEDRPFSFIGMLMMMSVLICAYALRVAERPVQDGFNIYANAMWCVIVTMTTVGYGDIYPISHPGRLAAVVSSLVGSAILALLIASVTKAISFDEAEEQVRVAMHKRQLLINLKNSASRLITATIREYTLKLRAEEFDKSMSSNKQEKSGDFFGQVEVKTRDALNDVALIRASTRLQVCLRHWRLASSDLRVLGRNTHDETKIVSKKVSNTTERVKQVGQDLDGFVRQSMEWQARMESQMERLAGMLETKCSPYGGEDDEKFSPSGNGRVSIGQTGRVVEENGREATANLSSKAGPPVGGLRWVPPSLNQSEDSREDSREEPLKGPKPPLKVEKLGPLRGIVSAGGAGLSSLVVSYSPSLNSPPVQKDLRNLSGPSVDIKWGAVKTTKAGSPEQ
jgi:hypothetical protein